MHKRMIAGLLALGVTSVALGVVFDSGYPRHVTVSNKAIACRTPSGLVSALGAAATASRLQLAKAMLVDRCIILKPGRQAVLTDYGGLFWWRAQVDIDGRTYYISRDAI